MVLLRAGDSVLNTCFKVRRKAGGGGDAAGGDVTCGKTVENKGVPAEPANVLTIGQPQYNVHVLCSTLHSTHHSTSQTMVLR
jgi:hypothetical protein